MILTLAGWLKFADAEKSVSFHKTSHMVAERDMLLPQERIPERTCEQVVDVHERQVVEQVLEVPEISSQDREVHGTVEQIVDAPVMQAVEELVEVSKVFSQDRIQQRIVEQTIPAISLAETIVVVPVIQTQGTTQRGVNTRTQHVVNAVEVEKPKIIELTVQRKKFIFQEKINQETKPVEFPQAQFLDKAGDMLIVMQQQMFTAQTAQKAMEVPPLQFIDKAMDIPVVATRQILPMTQTVQKTIEIPQLQCIDEVIDVPAVLVVPVPQVQVSGKTVEISQLQTAEKIVDTFDANGNRVANEWRRRDCVMREMRKNKPPFRLALNRAASDEIARHCKHCTERGVMKLHVSGTALAEGMRVPVSKMEELTAVTLSGFLEDGQGSRQRGRTLRIRAVSHGVKHVARQVQGRSFITTSCRESISQQKHSTKAHGQQHNNYHSKEAMQQRERKEEKGLGEREKGRKDEVGRDQEGGRKEKERKPEVKKDVTGWTVVTRNRRQRKMVQIFVRVNGSKATPMDVNLTDDKVEDVIRRIQNDEDVYVTMHGRVLKRGEKLKSYEVTDGCTIQVTSRLRGGGKHKDKKKQGGHEAKCGGEWKEGPTSWIDE